MPSYLIALTQAVHRTSLEIITSCAMFERSTSADSSNRSIRYSAVKKHSRHSYSTKEHTQSRALRDSHHTCYVLPIASPSIIHYDVDLDFCMSGRKDPLEWYNEPRLFQETTNVGLGRLSEWSLYPFISYKGIQATSSKLIWTLPIFAPHLDNPRGCSASRGPLAPNDGYQIF